MKVLKVIILVLFTTVSLLINSHYLVIELVFAKIFWSVGVPDDVSFIDIFSVFILYLPYQLSTLLVFVWAILHTRKTIGNGLFYGLLILVFNWLGFLFYLSNAFIAGTSMDKKTIRNISVLLLSCFSVNLLLPLYTDSVLDNISMIGEVMEVSGLSNYIQTMIQVVSTINQKLVSIYVAVLFVSHLKGNQTNPIIWIISTVFLGVIPWLVYNFTLFMRRD
ncbi:MAG: hypothetical protein N4A71_03200 [Carboxylicivirga sp.]|jgi:hypothetical protein|nr:hypothetical protein [Carboxylicivirga sp.]MCT4646467.1 hypothetical protein [Carboxylicivirga sp.]